MSIRVSNQIFNNVTRKLPLIFDSSGVYKGIIGTAGAINSIGLDTPASFGGVSRLGNQEIAMGRAGDDNSVSLVMKEIVTVKLWVWEGCVDGGRWVPGGGVAAEYTKLPDTAYGKIGFWLPKGQLFFLSADIVVSDAWVGAAAADGSQIYTGVLV